MGIALSRDRQPLKKHALTLTIDTLHNDDDPWPVEWVMFNVLNDWLRPDSNLSDYEAARCLAAIMPESRPACLNVEKEPAINWMLELSDLIWKVAKQIPCDHEGQDKLIQLLHALKRLPITHTIEDYQGKQLPAWDRLSHWHDSMRHALDYPEKRDSPDQQACDHYVNASAFAARVHAAGVQCPLRSHGFVAIQTAVEGVIPESEILPCHLIAGAQWIVLATEWLWRDIRWGEIDYHELKEDGNKVMASPPARWARWLRGFQEIANTGEGDDVKYWAGLAVTKMEEMMGTQGFTAEMMETWDPKKQSLWAGVWEDKKYAHLLNVPKKA